MPSKPVCGVEREGVRSEKRWKRGGRLGSLALLVLVASVPWGVATAETPASEAGLAGERLVEPHGHPIFELGDRVPEPIASIGHGAFFGPDGQQIVPTHDFVRHAQQWYRDKLRSSLGSEDWQAFADFEAAALEGLDTRGQTRMLFEQRSLEWLMQQVGPAAINHRMLGKIRALGVRLYWQLAPTDDIEHLRELRPFEPEASAIERLESIDATLEGRAPLRLATTNSGAAYEAECVSHQVPIPPTIGVLDPSGTAGWKSLGFIDGPEQFIIGSPAEVRSFESSEGMCIALPRYTSGTLTTVALDGVICLSKITSKVCIWDNQMSGTGFNFPAGAQIPIGEADLGIDPAGRYQAGGFELLGGSGGVCTDCHAGENPYIVHPNSDLGGGLLFGDIDNAPNNLPTFSPDRYDPIVAAAWPQNDLSMSPTYVPTACAGCHSQTGGAGRFPHLSTELGEYCNEILAEAITDTMPPWNPGDPAGLAAANAFRTTWCSMAPTAGPSDRGDPHLKTVDGTRYDFQSAGEFTALRNSATGFELQTRQTGVRTTFTPGPNAHTGLSSCPSLNTAVAARLGEHRVSIQPGIKGDCRSENIVFYLNGKATVVPAGGIDLGFGNRVARIGNNDGYELRASDGTRVMVTDHYWASQGYSYLNVEVIDTPAREGTMGAVIGGDWLPRAPDGSSFGPAPAGIPARDFLLNVTYADAWRVTNANSLFTYAPGTSTANFTDPAWPPPSGTPCDSWEVVPATPGCPMPAPVEPLPLAQAQTICAQVLRQHKGEDFEELFDECVFDVQVTGNPQMAEGLVKSLAARNGPCGTCVP